MGYMFRESVFLFIMCEVLGGPHRSGQSSSVLLKITSYSGRVETDGLTVITRIKVGELPIAKVNITMKIVILDTTTRLMV